MREVWCFLCSLSLVWSVFAVAPIARWDVVPYQRVKGVFNVGVVAFHPESVKVDFYVNGQRAGTALKMELNQRTGVREFYFPLVVKNYPDGELKLTAKALAPDGGVKELPVLTLYADEGGTQGSKRIAWVDPKNGNEFGEATKEQPAKSIKHALKKCGDGGFICLLPGTYPAKLFGGGKTRRYWTTILPAPGVKRGQVKLTGGRPGCDKLRFRNLDLMVDGVDGYGTLLIGEGGSTCAWIDRCRMYNAQGRQAGIVSPFGNKLRAFVTGGESFDLGNGPDAEITRDHQIRNLLSDAFSGNDKLVVNCSVEGIDATGSDCDPDFYRGFAAAGEWTKDVILYGVKGVECRCRGLSGARLKDCAFVDLEIAATGGELVKSQFGDLMDNVIFRRVKLVGQTWMWVHTGNHTLDFTPKDVLVERCEIPEMTGYTPTDGSSGLLVR